MDTKRQAAVVEPLTSLRFFAAFAVVVFHSGSSYLRDRGDVARPVVNFFLNGYTGVTFFFVLSGFILQLIYSGRLIDAADVRRFFEARFARIYPVYLFALLLLIPFMATVGRSSIAQFLLLQSWQWNGHPTLENWNMPAWTLSIELLFYLLFAPISRLATRVGRRAIFAAAGLCASFILITASSSAVSSMDAGALHAWMVMVPIPVLRLPEFVLGVVTGELARRTGVRDRPSPSPPLLGIVLIGALMSSTDKHVAGLVTILSAALIYALATNRGGWLYRGLSGRPLVLLGAASYSLYLLYSPLRHGFNLISEGSKALLLLQYPTLVALSLIVFRFYEEPVREALRAYWKMRRSAIARI